MLENVEQAKALAAKILREEEGFAFEWYDDPGDGSPRIGYGSACPEGVTDCSWRQAESMMAEVLEQRTVDVHGLLGPLTELAFSVNRLAVLYCMAYQLGYTGLCGFQNMIRAIFQDDFETASDEMLDSAWHKQTPARCERLATMFRSG